MNIFYILLFFFSLLIISAYNLLCGEEEIEHCIRCGEGENSDSCEECEDKYFPFLNNVLCLPCDNPLYGMNGCGGKCDATNYNKTRNLKCEENACKVGFYYIEGYCIPCSKPVENCGKCTYAPPAGINSNETLLNHFTCDECISNQYLLISNSYCRHCSLWKCSICHYEPNGRQVCDKCYDGYYVNSTRLCSRCYWVSIYGGECYVCSDNRYNYDSGYCYCRSFYTLSEKSTCLDCPPHCAQCNYNKLTNSYTCFRCGIGYILNNEGECVSCGTNCAFCYLDNNQNPICTSCFYGHTLNDDKNCLDCPENCKSCKKDSNEQLICTSCWHYGHNYNYHYYGINSQKRCEECPDKCTSCHADATSQMICTSCLDSYGINAQNLCENCPTHCHNCFWKRDKGKFGCSYCYKDYKYSHQNNYIEGKDDICIRCQDINEIGGRGCISCSYNRYNDNSYKCYRCLGDTTGYWPPVYDPIKDYAYIRNTYQCFTNLERTPEYLHGCLYGEYNSNTNKYECSSCKSGFIPVYNEKSCKIPSDINLSPNCYRAEKIGNNYSCLSCSTTIITDHLGFKNCYDRNNELIRCLEGTKDENGKLQCTLCLSNFQFIENNNHQKICDDKCDSESFLRWSWCYKCNDAYSGNPGCDLSEGCTYSYTNDELDCVKCKDDYFSYTQGQCFSCFNQNPGCIQCNLDTINKKVLCSKCSEGYLLNNDEQKCEPITCTEYPEIMTGCLICSDKREEYIPRKKCQNCRQGFFKTKDESCVFCKAEKNGGPACQECEFAKDNNGTETNEIKCKYCSKDGILSSDGKCYNCQEELGDSCTKCSFVKNDEDGKDILKCQACKTNYVLSPNGHCIHYQSYYKLIPHCLNSYLNVKINNITYNDNISVNESYYNNKSNLENNYGQFLIENNITESNESSYNITIESICLKCKDGYYLTKEGYCESIDIEECSFLNIFLTGEYNKFISCKELCQNKNYVLIDYFSNEKVEDLYDNNSDIYDNYSDIFNYSNINDDNNTSNNSLETNKYKLNIELIINKYGLNNYTFDSLSNDTKTFIMKGYSCLGNLGNGQKNQPQSLKKCKRSEYLDENNTYICKECITGYVLDDETNMCKQGIKITMNLRPGLDNCFVENIGTDLDPIYSCKFCYNAFDILIQTENGAKFCETPFNQLFPWLDSVNYELEGCTEVNANTTYLNNIYNCTNCSLGYISYYSRFFKRKICQNVYENIIRNKEEFDSTIFNDAENITAKDGKCDSEKLFTPDNQRCYSCNNRQVGMVGCKGTCTFSTKRNNVLECEDGGCKSGYLEKSRGICESCDSINQGCIECHYESNYLSDYQGLKRERRFVCDQCDEGYLRSEDGTCHNCTELGFKNCDKCKRDDTNDGDLVCYKCLEGYFLTSEGECTKCENNQVRGNNNICINCDNAEEGGIEGCNSCISENNKIVCQECKNGFILFEGNKTCLRISENEELEELTNCQQALLDNNKLICSKCNNDYILLKENDKNKCVPYKFIASPYPEINWLCESYINQGSEDFPKYSCENCNNLREYYYKSKFSYNSSSDIYGDCKYECHMKYQDDIGEYKYIMPCIDECQKDKEKGKNPQKSLLTKIYYAENNTAFCDYSLRYEILENCTEAVLKLEQNKIKINCTKCRENSNLTYHVDTNSFICRYNYYEKNCVAKYCKTCKRDNNYFCEACLPADYEPNPITGVCVKKTEKVPAITWKDIFRLEMNEQREINGRTLYGPALMLRGLTNSQINTGHAFLIYSIFNIEYSRTNRHLEEESEKKIPFICQIVDSVDETDEANIVEYDCIGNLTKEEDEKLTTDFKLQNIIEEENLNQGVLGNSNLNEIANKTDLKNLDTNPTYTIGNLVKTSIFTLDEIKNQTSNNYKFNFILNGKLDRELEPQTIEAKLELAEINNKKADCKMEIKENKTADLNCFLSIDDYKNYNYFTFKVGEIGEEENPIFLNKINEIYLINESKEKDKNKALLIGIIVGCIGGTIIILTIIFLIVRRSKKRDEIVVKFKEEKMGKIDCDSSEKRIK